MKIRIKFKKLGAMKFIGHLDMIRYFQKVMRRAGVDIRYSEGFSPHQIMSFAAPLGVGLTSSGEYVDIEVNSTENSKTMLDRINAANAEGLQAVSYRKLEDTAVNAMSLVAAADYLVWFRDGFAPEAEAGFWEDFLIFTCREQIPIMKKTKKGEKPMDLKPCIYEAKAGGIPFDDRSQDGLNADGFHADNYSTDNSNPSNLDGSDEKPAVFLKLSAGSAANVKPELLLGAYYDSIHEEYQTLSFQIHRSEVYAGEAGAFIALKEYGEDIE